jgi:hypothetical protein
VEEQVQAVNLQAFACAAFAAGKTRMAADVMHQIAELRLESGQKHPLFFVALYA